MMRLFWKTILPLLSILLALPIISARAQTESSPDEPAGVVTGSIVNQSENGPVPDDLEVMLHIWDGNYTERGMLHGQSEPGGTFRFEGVTLETGLFYAVMANYEEVPYFSDPVPAADGAEVLDITVPIYETIADLSQAGVDQMHVFFAPEQGGLGVTEIYVLNNQGNLTVKEALTLDDGTPVTLKFNLPVGAANINFQSNESGRFIQFPGGFADTAALIPGPASGQVVVSYVLPYTEGMPLSFAPPLVTQQVGFLIPQGVGLSLAGEGLTPEGTVSLREGLAVEVFSHAGLEAGETFQVSLSGELSPAPGSSTTMGTRVAAISRKPDPGLAIGAVVLGLALVVAGVWWWRRPGEAITLAGPEVSDLEMLVSEIASLDTAFANNQLDENAYLPRRKELLQQAGALVSEAADE